MRVEYDNHDKMFFNMIEGRCPRTGCYSLISQYFHLKESVPIFFYYRKCLSFFFNLVLTLVRILVTEHWFSFTCSAVEKVFKFLYMNCTSKQTSGSLAKVGSSSPANMNLSQMQMQAYPFCSNEITQWCKISRALIPTFSKA